MAYTQKQFAAYCMAGLIGRASRSGATDGTDYDYAALVANADDIADAIFALGDAGTSDEDDLCMATAVQSQIGKIPNDGTEVDATTIATFAQSIFNAFNPV